MELDKLIIGLLVFTIIILTGIAFIADVNNNYDDIDMSTDDFTDVYDTSNQVYNLSQDMKSSILGGEVDEDTTENSMFKGIFSALRFITVPFKLIGDLVNSIAKVLPIPSYFIVCALAALSIAITFTIIYIIFRIAKG